jgi:hypothetical protein
MDEEFQLEVTHSIYSNSGYYYELCPDPDTGECIELRYYDDVKDKDPTTRVLFPLEMVEQLIKALQAQKFNILLVKDSQNESI